MSSEMRFTVNDGTLTRSQFQPKHGTTERWNDCNCHDCRTNRVGRILDETEFADAVRDGVEVPWSNPSYFKRGTFHRRDNGTWYFEGVLTGMHGDIDVSQDDGIRPEMMPEQCAALDRVREYWRRRALAEMKAAEVARHLTAALSAAREHAMLFAKIADDGVLPVDRAQKFRSDAADLAHPIREIERLLNSYKVHGDVP